MPFTIAAVVAGTTAASTATVGGAAFVGATSAWGTAAITAGTIAADVALISGGMSAYGSYQQGQYAEDTGKYNAKVYAAQAESLEKAGEHETREERIEKRRLLARQLVSFAGGGVVPSAGTPQKIMTKTGAEMERDIGQLQYGYDIAGSQARGRGRIAKSYGKSRKRASLWQSGSTVMSGAARAYDYRFNV